MKKTCLKHIHVGDSMLRAVLRLRATLSRLTLEGQRAPERVELRALTLRKAEVQPAAKSSFFPDSLFCLNSTNTIRITREGSANGQGELMCVHDLPGH